MRPVSLYFYSLFAFLLITSTSCKKEEIIVPKLRIISPDEGSVFDFGDTIEIEIVAQNTDGNILLALESQNQTSSLNYKRQNQEGNSYFYQMFFTDPYLTSGTYTLRATAFNGDQRKSDFININLNEKPLRLRGILAVEETPGGATLFSLDSLTNRKSLIVNSYSNAFLAYQNRAKKAYVANESTTSIFTTDVFPFRFDAQLQFPDVQNGQKTYRELVKGERYVYILADNGWIRAYEGNQNIYSYKLDNNLQPVCAEWAEDRLAVVCQERGVENYFLRLLKDDNGANLKEVKVSGVVVDMVYVKEGKYILALRDNDNTKILVYNSVSNTLTERYTLSEEPLSLVADFRGNCLLSTTEKIFLFNPESSSFPQEVYSFAASDMEYDMVSQDLWIASGNTIYRGKMWGGATPVYQSSSPISQLEIVYNK